MEMKIYNRKLENLCSIVTILFYVAVL